MPVRPRRRRQPRWAITLQRELALMLGPEEGDEPLEVLREVYREHHQRYGPNSWAHRRFVDGVDERDAIEPVTNACPGLPGLPE